MKKVLTPSLLIVIAASLWALDGVLRRSLYSLPAVTIVFYEHLFGTALLVPMAYKQLQEVKWTTKILGLTLVLSVVSGLLGTLWFTQALAMINFIPFSVVLLLQKLQPLFAITAAAILLKEKVSARYIGWATVALVAAYFVTFPLGRVDIQNTASIVAALLAIGAAAAWGSSTAVSKLLLREVSSTVATSARFMMTSVVALVGVFALNQSHSLPLLSLPQVGTLLLIAVSTGMVALWIYYKGLRDTKAQVATLLELVFPLLAVFIDAFVYKVVLHPSQYLAAVLLLYAMYNVSQNGREDAN